MPVIKDVLLATEGDQYSVWKIFDNDEGSVKVFGSDSVLDAQEKAEEVCKEYGFEQYLCGKIKVEE